MHIALQNWQLCSWICVYQKLCFLFPSYATADFTVVVQHTCSLLCSFADSVVVAGSDLQESASLLRRCVPGHSVDRMMRGLLRYIADALMLQLMSGEGVVPSYMPMWWAFQSV